MIENLHVALEYKKGVGGLRTVTNGLLPALAATGEVKVSIVTPYWDFFNGYYLPEDIAQIATVFHIYRGLEYRSRVFRARGVDSNGAEVLHYLIRPAINSPVARIFDVGDEKNIYHAFDHSQKQFRLEYFNSAVASMVRTPNVNIPTFDIVHVHTWQTGLSACLIKEFENIKDYTKLIQTTKKELRPIPHVVGTIHMLAEREHGLLSTGQSVRALINSVGLPVNFEQSFLDNKDHIRAGHLKQLVLGLLYLDGLNIVSKGLAKEVISGKGCGIDNIFKKMHQEQQLRGITNGINVKDWDPLSQHNLQEFIFEPGNIVESKNKIKQHLANIYTQLDPSKIWYLYVGRFAEEKGMDMLPHALQTIRDNNCEFILMGVHIPGKDNIPSRYKVEIDALKEQNNLVVIEDPAEQQLVGKLFRAASEFTLCPSHNEACGLVPMEAISCASMPISSDVQGLPDSVISLIDDFESGTGFIYSDALESRIQNMQAAIYEAKEFYDLWQDLGLLESLLARLMQNAHSYDWTASPALEYLEFYKQTLQQKIKYFAQIRTDLDASLILNQFKSMSLANTAAASAPLNKVFQIGFNKCGTQTIHNLFCVNKIPAVHYHYGKLAISVHDNFINNRPLLSEEYQQYVGFFDMENIYTQPPIYIAQLYFRELDQQYPGSKFILNTRDKQAWLKSRAAHSDMANGRLYIDVIAESSGLSHEEVIESWAQEWDQHHQAVLEYFKDRPGDLLVFNIETDPPEVLSIFLAPYFNLDPNMYTHLNKTPSAALTPS